MKCTSPDGVLSACPAPRAQLATVETRIEKTLKRAGSFTEVVGVLPGHLSLASLRPLWAAMLPQHTHRRCAIALALLRIDAS